MMLRALALFAAVASLPAIARAECMAPRAALAPSQGTLPKKSVLHLFVPTIPSLEHADIEQNSVTLGITDEHGAALPHQTTLVSRTGAFTTYRIAVDAEHATNMKVVAKVSIYGRPETLEASYAISKKHARTPSSGVEILSEKAVWFHWPCSYSETRELIVDRQAPAFRIVWSESEGGDRKSIVLPGARSLLFGQEFPGDKGRIDLGHVSCLGFTFEWKEAPIYVAVQALYADGTESELPSKLMRLDPPTPEAAIEAINKAKK